MSDVSWTAGLSGITKDIHPAYAWYRSLSMLAEIILADLDREVDACLSDVAQSIVEHPRSRREALW